MRDTEQLEQTGRSALLGQFIGAVVTVALMAVVAVQVPDLMIWILR
ncbi:hypothetical protein HU811_07810 [Pseudomonas sp. SWRI196]|uniref:Uncharacterized protein n=1 Tax=Pseudomonas tehranensis TaxID=2745502 RepID=A0ABR6UPM6_9PSED|nr:hypothetical protein [Pseudomonas tehranensis]MBC3346536.1 hypothetical protein [Pseudomonas tehranensis]